MLRYYKPQYGEVKYIGKNAEVDVEIPMPDCTVRFTYRFILCKDRIVIAKSHHQYSHMVGERMTTDVSKVVESFLKLNELRYH